jgi:penicillin-binding protein 2
MTHRETERRMGGRLLVLQVGTVAVFCVLAVGFWLLQVAQHQRYEEMAENNHQRTLALRAPRGVIVDRDGRVMVENRSAYTVSIVREQSADLEATMALLAEVAGVDLDGIRRTMDARRREPAYRPVVVIDDASLAQVAAITARRLEFELPDVVIEEVPTRQYRGGAMASHLFGYIGEASSTQVAGGIPNGEIIGQSGVERIYNDLLMGQRGARHVVVNSLGREIRTLEEVPPTQGRRIQLTIDQDLQRAAEDAFREAGFDGSAVFLDPHTGEVLSLVSLPGYDPNDFAGGIDQATWTALNENVLRPLQNRAIQGRYSPGSVFKIVVAAAALEEGIVDGDVEIPCAGSATFYGNRFHCHRAGGHGLMTLRHAIEQSCNVYFYTVGNMLGIEKIHEYAEKLGLTGLTGIDLPNEQASLVPSPEWKQETTGERWYPGETISVSIGQGQVSVTPVSLAVMMATVANGGTRVTPHVVRAVDDGDGWEPVAPPAAAGAPALRPETLAVIGDGLWMAVNAQGGAGRARVEGRDVVGKTGTAQVVSNRNRAAAAEAGVDVRDHGWFAFFAPKDNPQIAGVVFAEHGEHGYLAAPIARHVIETYFAKQEGRPLPSLRIAPGPPEHDPDTVPIFAGGVPVWGDAVMQD